MHKTLLLLIQILSIIYSVLKLKNRKVEGFCRFGCLSNLFLYGISD